MVMYMKTLGEKLREIREDNEFPQKHVADLLGIHRPNYSKIENNTQNLTPHQIKLFCEFFKVSADYLLDIRVDDKKTLSKFEQEFLLRYIDKMRDTIK